MHPKHTRNVKETTNIKEKEVKNRAVAPYNFVELPEAVVKAELENGYLRSHDCYHSNRHTGKIDCTLTTSSPLYIRCGLTQKEFSSGKESKELSDFFYTDLDRKVPTLPGSSLRGMLRSLVEIAGYGKLNLVSDRPLVYRAVADTSSIGNNYRNRLLREVGNKTYEFRAQAGYMRVTDNGEWKIIPAQEISPEESFARIEHSEMPSDLISYFESKNAFYIFAQEISPIQAHDHNKNRQGRARVRLRYAKVSSALNEPVDGDRANGVLVKTGYMNGKHMEYVFGLPDETGASLPIPETMVAEYREQITKEQKDLLGDEAALRPNQPVFYLVEDNKLVFFGHTMMLRLPFQNSIKDFVPESLKDPDTIDLAEAIFGFVRQDKNHGNRQSVASRVFISDGQCVQPDENVWLLGDAKKTITPKILSSPKPTTFQHYLVQDNIAKASRSTLNHYENKPIEKTVLRGHKLYWHKGESPDILSTSKKKIVDGKVVASTQTTQIKPIKPGVQFTFSLNFENLSTVELGALLWVLSIAQDNRYRLSLGMGKPLGMGAVSIHHRTYLSNRAERYSQLFDANGWTTGYSVVETENSYTQSFEAYVLGSGNSQQTLDEDRRIRMLLAMLQWDDAPPSALTRYMEIERDVREHPDDYIGRGIGGKANEYSERPVLPTPLQVIEQEEVSQYAVTVRPIKQKSEKQTERQQAITSIITDQNLEEGDILEAKVVKKGSKKKVTYEINEVPFNEKEAKNYDVIPEGESVRVRVTSLINGIIKHIKFVERI